MDSLTSSALLGGIITYLLPIEDTNIKIQIGLFGSQILNYLVGKSNINFYNYFKKKKNKLIIANKYGDDINPIYYQVEEHFIKNYISEIENLQLVPKNGEINFSSYNEIMTELKDKFKNYDINLNFNPKNDNTDNKENKNNDFIIEISSKNAPLDILKEYTQYICENSKPDTSIIKIFKVRCIHNDKNSKVDWDSMYIKTNKNYKNTFVNENIQVELFDDIDNFIKNEIWYSEKGIPYKKGYLLHGPPGTGKTSIIKAIANNHQLPIFNLDLSSVKNNTDLLKLVTDINCISNNKKYIVTIEDIDRCPLFSKSYDRHRQLEKNTLSIDCLLNVLDGIIETNGRLFFITANNIDVFNDVKDVLFRPGRIDKILNITYCSIMQIKNIICNYYNIDHDKLDNFERFNFNKVTPASLIKKLQDHETFDTLLDSFLENEDQKSGDLIIPDRFKKNQIDINKEKLAILKKDIRYYKSRIKKNISLAESIQKRNNNLELQINNKESAKNKIELKIKLLKEKDKEKEKLKKEKKKKKK